MAKKKEGGDRPEEPKGDRKEVPIRLPKLDVRCLEIPIVGDSELICHAWSAKAQRQMLETQTGTPTAGREKKDPVADFLGACYTISPGKVQGDTTLAQRRPDGHPDVWIKGGEYGFPLIAFKAAAVEACTSLGKSITKVAARQAFHVIGEIVTVQGTPRMRQDMVRLSGRSGPPDIRFRPGFPDWKAKLLVRFNARVLTAEQVVNLFNTAGFAVGVGEWRSERDGSYGLFHVEG